MITELNLKEGMNIIDIYGNPHPLSQHHVRVMLGVGWACFLGSGIVNLAYYMFHPSKVDVLALEDKKVLYVLGCDIFSEKRSELHQILTEGT